MIGYRLTAMGLIASLLTPCAGLAKEPGPALPGSMFLSDCIAALKPIGEIKDSEYMNVGHCLGYVGGFKDAHVIGKAVMPLHRFCPPNGVDTGQLTRVFVKYLQDHPEQLHLDAGLLLWFALEKAFPCDEESSE